MIFGEIIPSAFFTGPRQLEIASFFAPFVGLLQSFTSLVVVPIARLLDNILGLEHKGRYNKAELKAFLSMQARTEYDDDRGAGLVQDEIRMVHGAMEMSKRTVRNCMVPLDRV